jgi:hypothetical protein
MRYKLKTILTALLLIGALGWMTAFASEALNYKKLIPPTSGPVCCLSLIGI